MQNLKLEVMFVLLFYRALIPDCDLRVVFPWLFLSLKHAAEFENFQESGRERN